MATPLNTSGRPDARPSIGALFSSLSEQLSQLIRDEIRLAKAELSVKGKHAGKGAGLLGGAALMGFFGFAALVATAIIALSYAVEPWLAALIVAILLLVVAAVLALAGKKALQQGLPPVPERTQANVKRDVEAVKEGLNS